MPCRRPVSRRQLSFLFLDWIPTSMFWVSFTPIAYSNICYDIGSNITDTFVNRIPILAQMHSTNRPKKENQTRRCNENGLVECRSRSAVQMHRPATVGFNNTPFTSGNCPSITSYEGTIAVVTLGVNYMTRSGDKSLKNWSAVRVICCSPSTR